MDRIYKPLLVVYLKADRKYRFASLELLIRPGIFHPKFFFSTGNLLKFLQKTELEGKSLLDLGTGSGILGLYAASMGAIVTASDISAQAVQNADYNARFNQIEMTIIQSDLFENIKHHKYDIIVINPPYYPRDPEKESDYAWYCGDGFEYYHKLFEQISSYLHKSSLAILSLAETCNLEMINHIAGIYDLGLALVEQKNYLWEKQFIFSIIKH